MVSQEEIRRSELESLRIFRDFCDKHGLKYYLSFGTLLGAVRHKGFIPWDDDIDVLMPRSDYQFLLEHFNAEAQERRKVTERELNPRFYCNFAKVYDDNYVLQEFDRPVPTGPWIDVYPMDCLPVGKWERWWFVFANRWLNRIRRTVSRFGYFPCSAWFMRKRKAMLEASMRPMGADVEYGLLYRTFRGHGTPVIPYAMLEPSARLEFEGDVYPVPREYDAFLQGCYGDYWKLPDSQKRRGHAYECRRREMLEEGSSCGR